jgi:hypothetical protein
MQFSWIASDVRQLAWVVVANWLEGLVSPSLCSMPKALAAPFVDVFQIAENLSFPTVLLARGTVYCAGRSHSKGSRVNFGSDVG